MLKNLNRLFIDITNSRAAEIANNIAASNKGYKELVPKIIEMLNDIKNNLPEEYKEVLEELEDVMSKRDLLINEIIYRQGLIDGIKIGNAYNKLKSKESFLI